jgi:sec-independent protein translocase protein TatA
MPDLGKPEILILLIVILVLFGAKRLPGAARSLGQSMRIFKAETKGLRSDEDASVPPPAAAPAPAVQLPPPASEAAAPITPPPPAMQDSPADRR